MTDTSDRIDFSRLGFEIAVPTSDDSCSAHGSGRRRSQQQQQEQQDAGEPSYETTTTQDGETLAFRVVPVDNVSVVSFDTYDDDISDDDSYVPPRRNMPTKAFPRRTTYCCGRSVSQAQLTSEDLGYEPAPQQPQQPSQQDLGYGEEAVVSSGRPGLPRDDASKNSIRRLSMGRPVRNRRSMKLCEQRRLTNDSMISSRFSRRRSTCSGTTTSSMTSGKMRRAHSKGRNVSQRERMVTRSASRRLSRKNPAQISVSAAPCCGPPPTAAQQTLQDLGCSELFLDPRRRVPRRVSLEYGNDSSGSVGNNKCHQPQCVSLEFDNSSMSSGGALMPRRVSLKYVQRAEDDQSSRVLRRRGSLDFSVGTSCLPRRGSLGKSSHSHHHHHQHCHQGQQDKRRASCGCNQTYYAETSVRRASSGSGSIPPRQNSDNSKNTRVSRRSSIAHIPRKQIKKASMSPKRTSQGSVKTGHGGRLRLPNVAAVESLTRDTVVGRTA